MSEVETVQCVNWGDETGCVGPIEYRMPISGTGRSFPRCDKHWQTRLDHEEGLRRRYPEQPPADWSPDDAGEAWDESDY